MLPYFQLFSAKPSEWMESRKREDHLRKGSEVSPYESLLAGSISGAVARAVTAPLDTIKIRLQLQRSAFRSRVSVTTVVKDLLKNEGAIALWKGNVPAEILYVLYGAAQFTTYSSISRWLSHLSDTSGFNLPSSAHSLVSGTGAGVVSTLVTYPFDLLRTRLAANSEKKLLSMSGTAREIISSEGFTGLFAGIKPAMLSISTTTGLMFWSYELVRETLGDRDIPFKEGICGFIAGATSKGITFPLDTIRKRTQMYKILYNSAKRVGAFRLLADIVANEGVLGLYKGFGISVLKTSPTSAVSLFVYEYSLAAIQRINRKTLD